jgi:hypothetical protein
MCLKTLFIGKKVDWKNEDYVVLDGQTDIHTELEHLLAAADCTCELRVDDPR